MYVNDDHAANLKLSIFQSIMGGGRIIDPATAAKKADEAYNVMYGDKKATKRKAAKKK